MRRTTHETPLTVMILVNLKLGRSREGNLSWLIASVEVRKGEGGRVAQLMLRQSQAVVVGKIPPKVLNISLEHGLPIAIIGKVYLYARRLSPERLLPEHTEIGNECLCPSIGQLED